MNVVTQYYCSLTLQYGWSFLARCWKSKKCLILGLWKRAHLGQEKHDWCHEMICVFLPIVEHANWIVSTMEYVSSWVLVKLLTNYLLLCWCCVWCINAYSSVVGPLCVSVVVSSVPWQAVGKLSVSAWFYFGVCCLFCSRGWCILSSSSEWKVTWTIASWLRPTTVSQTSWYCFSFFLSEPHIYLVF